VKLKRSIEKTLKSGGWLTDEHIHPAQEILKDQFPHIDGFQSPLLAQNDGFVPVPFFLISLLIINRFQMLV